MWIYDQPVEGYHPSLELFENVTAPDCYYDFYVDIVVPNTSAIPGSLADYEKSTETIYGVVFDEYYLEIQYGNVTIGWTYYIRKS